MRFAAVREYISTGSGQPSIAQPEASVINGRIVGDIETGVSVSIGERRVGMSINAEASNGASDQ